jgi:hypothetical protein
MEGMICFLEKQFHGRRKKRRSQKDQQVKKSQIYPLQPGLFNSSLFEELMKRRHLSIFEKEEAIKLLVEK